MFPFCLINASVTDAEGIRSRLVSFPPTLFSSVCHIAFPVALFKKQTGSAFPVFILTQPIVVFFKCCFCQIRLVDQIFFFLPSPADCWIILKCQTAQAGTVKQQTFPAWCGWFHIAALALSVLFFSSMTHYFTFINLTHQSRRP